ncbi:TPA: permease [archaeon]|uniref:Permease n=1 Tax=Candidatus Naiadarchaeum limnaeum TaxID=2756139 RepID=A0A832V559_9ARCH|nr:permease [Candidatus Naiadarchaeales archaeon SRR2090153.bin1042]HIK00450.1 permease [Candidatus Naiadarchaeum limnaeum]
MSIKAYIDYVRIHTISLAIAVTAIILYAITLAIRPELFAQSFSKWVQFFMFFLPFVVAIIGVLGLLEAYLPAEVVSKYLGDKRKVHGYIFALVFGTVVSASQYAIFPTIKFLRKKGARTAILATFMMSWSGISLPLIPLELKIFGLKFVLLRLIIIAIAALIFGIITGLREIHMER